MAFITVKIERQARPVGASTRHRSIRRFALVGVGLVAVATTLVATAGSARAKVITIPATTIVNAVTVTGGGHVSPAVTGASTTVPTDATRVVMAVTISGTTAAGHLTVGPAGSPSVANIAYTSGHTVNSNVTSQVGLSNQDTFTNTGANSVTLTVKLTGYSTEVRTADISPTGGTAGQVLTNTGSAVTWQAPSQAYETNDFNTVSLGPSFTTVVSVTVPAGSYLLNFDTTIAGSTSSTPDNVACYLSTPAGQELSIGYGNTYATDDQSMISLQGLFTTTSGGTPHVDCADSNATAAAYYPSLTATSVGATHGFVGSASPGTPAIPHGARALKK